MAGVETELAPVGGEAAEAKRRSRQRERERERVCWFFFCSALFYNFACKVRERALKLAAKSSKLGRNPREREKLAKSRVTVL